MFSDQQEQPLMFVQGGPRAGVTQAKSCANARLISSDFYTFISSNLILPNLICYMPPIVDLQVAQYIAGTFGHISIPR